MNFLRELAKAVVAITLVFGIFSAGFIATDHIKSSRLREFCNSIQDQRSAEAVMAQAKERGFPVFPPTHKRSVVSVLNHSEPFFRYECAIEIQDGHVVRTEINGAD